MFISAAELNTHLYGEVTDEISRADASIASAAINSAVAEARGYLSFFDRDAIFATTGTSRDAALLTFIKDIAVWHFIQLCNPGIDLAIRQDRYNRAIKWLEQIQKGIVVPDFPLPTPATDPAGNVIPSETAVTWGSNPKNQYNY